MHLKQVTHDHTDPLFCGDAALSSITGKSTSWCRSTIDRIKRYPNGGVIWETLREICIPFGIHFVLHGYHAKLIDLNPWSLSVVDDGAGHYVVTEDGLMTDSCNNLVPISQTRFKESLVRYTFLLLHESDLS